MGKGEELHMELEFDRDVIHCWEIAADGTLCQEETLETIVPDACPDILRIVAVCGQATLNGKQAREGAAAVSGSVRAVLLYQPEEGGGLRRMEAALPFSRSHSTALSISPSEAVSAFLQSIMPTPVISRRVLTSAALKAIFISSSSIIYKIRGRDTPCPVRSAVKGICLFGGFLGGSGGLLGLLALAALDHECGCG